MTWRQKQGVTLLELMLVLSVIAIILVAATLYYQQDQERAKIDQAMAQVATIKQAVDDYLANVEARTSWKAFVSQFNGGSRQLSGLQTLINSGLLTESFAKSPWNTAVNCYAHLDHPRSIVIEVTDLPTSSCQALAAALKKSGMQSITKRGQGDIGIYCYLKTHTHQPTKLSVEIPPPLLP